jgi:hypothetical protein
LHSPVEPAGAPAGAWEKLTVATRRAATNETVRVTFNMGCFLVTKSGAEHFAVFDLAVTSPRTADERVQEQRNAPNTPLDDCSPASRFCLMLSSYARTIRTNALFDIHGVVLEETNSGFLSGHPIVFPRQT